MVDSIHNDEAHLYGVTTAPPSGTLYMIKNRKKKKKEKERNTQMSI